MKRIFVSLVILLFTTNLFSKDDDRVKPQKKSASGLMTLFPEGYLRAEVFGEYEDKRGRNFRPNTSYQQRFYLGSRFVNGLVHSKLRFSFLKKPFTREVTFEDTELSNTLSLIESHNVALKLRMLNVFPTSLTTTRTRTVLSGNASVLGETITEFGRFVMGVAVWASNEIYQRKKIVSRQEATSRYGLVGVERPWVEVEHPVDLDLETGFVIDYTHPSWHGLFVEVDGFDQRRWMSHGEFEHLYYLELYARIDVNPRVYFYHYTKWQFDEQFALAAAAKGGAIRSRLAFGLNF